MGQQLPFNAYPFHRLKLGLPKFLFQQKSGDGFELGLWQVQHLCW